MGQILDMLRLVPSWVYVWGGIGIVALFGLVFYLERPR